MMILQALVIAVLIAGLWLPLLFRLTRVPYNSPEERSLLDLFRRHVAARIKRMNAEADAQRTRKNGAYR